MRQWAWSIVVVMACVPPTTQYGYRSNETGAPERTLEPVEARVVSSDEAERSGLAPQPLALPFAGARDGTEVVAQYLAAADRAQARLISELAIVIESTREGRPIACRTEVVPEELRDTQLRPGRHHTVPVSRPVQRTVTEMEYRCRHAMKPQTRTVTESERQCGTVQKPVTRTRTTYSSQYDWASKSTKQVPRTETYTAYESHYECNSRPVTKSKTEMVSSQDCRSEPVTRQVTRYEFQLESQYIPPRWETVTRQRLRELEPVCVELDLPDEPGVAPPSVVRGNRIEGRIYR
jgi:hypothetical protein